MSDQPRQLFDLAVEHDEATDRVTLRQTRCGELKQVVLHRSQLDQVIEWLIEIADGDQDSEELVQQIRKATLQ